jgi:hypothetical protein
VGKKGDWGKFLVFIANFSLSNFPLPNLYSYVDHIQLVAEKHFFKKGPKGQKDSQTHIQASECLRVHTIHVYVCAII